MRTILCLNCDYKSYGDTCYLCKTSLVRDYSLKPSTIERLCFEVINGLHKGVRK